MKIRLANGWTFSVVPDLMMDGFFSVAAWHTADDLTQTRVKDVSWYVFEKNGIERRVSDIKELLEYAEIIGNLEDVT